MPRATWRRKTPARRLADLGFPLYTLAFGQARGLGQARDVALKDLSVNQTVFVKNELTVHGTARIDGFGGQNIPVQLLFESPGGQDGAGRRRRSSRPARRRGGADRVAARFRKRRANTSSRCAPPSSRANW